MRILTTMFCFGGRVRGVCLGGRRGAVRGGFKVAVSECVCGVGRGGGGDGVNACQPHRASSVQRGQLGVSTRL